MSTEVSAVPTTVVNIPEIVVIEPSPVIQNPSVTSAPIQEKTAPTQEGNTDELRKSLEETETNISASEHISAPEQGRDSNSELSTVEVGTESTSLVEVVLSEQAEPTTVSSEIDPDEFRTRGCCHLNVDCEGPYKYLWKILVSRYAIPFWLLAMSLPVSAGIMGAVYMFECPAADSLPNMVFMIGISLLAVFTFRVCIIIHRLTWENSSPTLQTMHLICLFITVLFFLTESATFWQMSSGTHLGAKDFCNPIFSTYVFWWNIAMSAFMLLLLLFPEA